MFQVRLRSRYEITTLKIRSRNDLIKSDKQTSQHVDALKLLLRRD